MRPASVVMRDPLAMRPFSSSAVIAKPILGGLHHEYRWGKAA
jgi:hypothetical protein